MGLKCSIVGSDKQVSSVIFSFVLGTEVHLVIFGDELKLLAFLLGLSFSGLAWDIPGRTSALDVAFGCWGRSVFSRPLRTYRIGLRLVVLRSLRSILDDILSWIVWFVYIAHSC